MYEDPVRWGGMFQSYSQLTMLDVHTKPHVSFWAHTRPQDKSAYWKIIFFVSHPKHMLCVLKRTVSMRQRKK